MTRTDIPPMLPEAKFEQKIPEGDDRIRSICTRCDFIHYKNPLIVVGSVATANNQILLCKRAIAPQKGYWTLPAGYMELRETIEDGAIREAWEEAGAKLEIDQQLAMYSIPRLSQVQIMFRARLLNPDTIKAGIESEEIGLFNWQDIPWQDLAFPTVYWALNHYYETKQQENFVPFTNPIEGV